MAPLVVDADDWVLLNDDDDEITADLAKLVLDIEEGGVSLTGNASFSDFGTSSPSSDDNDSSLLSDSTAPSPRDVNTLVDVGESSSVHAPDITYDGCTTQNLPVCPDGNYFAVHFQDCYLDDVIFDNCFLRRVRFENCLLVNVCFSNVVLVDVDISDCNFNDYLWQTGRVWESKIANETHEDLTRIEDEQPAEITDKGWIESEKNVQQKRLEEANRNVGNPRQESGMSHITPTYLDTPLYKDKKNAKDEWEAYADEQEAMRKANGYKDIWFF